MLQFRNIYEGRNVPKSNEQRVDEAVVALVEAARAATDGNVTRVTVDIASAPEYPYRLDQPDVTYPLIGLARP